MYWTTAALVSCLACAAGKSPQTPAGARVSTSEPAAAEDEIEPNAGDLTADERARFLTTLNELCADTYCEGAFGFEFDRLECLFEEEACVISFVMFTQDATRPGVVPTRLETAPEAEEPYSAVIESVVPPAECDPNEMGMEPGGPPCTIVEASCVLSPIRSVAEFEDQHWDLLSHCVFGLEDAILADAPL